MLGGGMFLVVDRSKEKKEYKPNIRFRISHKIML